ncbi:MAG: hypothetical protein JNJ61_17730 [Anaerolineae bacterium]|nr:hypothetical protein [Anaerolineae bacterium]
MQTQSRSEIFRWLGLGIALFIAALVTNPSETSAQGCDLNAIVQDVGQYQFAGSGDPKVILMQERHDLVTAQIEGAIMIYRLTRDCGFRVVGLEAAFPDTSFDTQWFTASLPQNIQPYIAVRVLGEGEISQAEFAAMVYPSIFDGFKVVGIESADLYNQEFDFGESGGIDLAMIYTGLTQLSESDLSEALTKLEEAPGTDEDPDAYNEWYDDFTSFVFTNSTNQDIQDWYAASQVEGECVVNSIEAEIDNLDLAIQIVSSLQSSTEEMLGVELTENLRDAESVRGFYVNAHDRSVVMVDEIEASIQQNSNAPVVAIIGAAHTEWMVDTLQTSGYGTAVVSPQSFCDDSTGVSLSDAAYGSKEKAMSVDMPGLLGAILTGNSKKLPVVLEEPWFQIKTVLYGLATLVTDGLAQNPNATLEEILGAVPLIPGVTVDMASLQPVPGVPDRWTFRVTLNVDGVRAEEIFIGIGTTGISEPGNYQTPTELDIEQLLLQELEQLREEGLPEVDPGKPETLLTEVAPDVRAAFSTNQATAISIISSK